MDFFFHHSELGWLIVPQVALTIWMLVDASRRRVEPFWYFIVLIVQPFGAWAYFLIHKLPDWRGGSLGGLGGLGGLFQRRASLDELRYRVQQTPTLANHLALAERLVEWQEYAEAVPHLETVVQREPQHCHALFALATSHTRLGKADQAVPVLEKLIARDRWWSNYAAWRLMIEAKEALADRVGALETCRELARLAPTLENRCLLAEQLLSHGLVDEARALLQTSLDEHRFAPGPIRRRNRHWASVARRLQRQIPSRV